MLVYMAGVLQLAIFNALHMHWHRPVIFTSTTSGEWKRDVVAADGYAPNGQFGKPDKKKDQTLKNYPAYTWALNNGYRGDDVNEVDAYCIAEKARRVYVDSMRRRALARTRPRLDHQRK